MLSENDVVLKCYRKEINFHLFNNCLKNKYPYLALPRLNENKEVSLNKREQNLNSYLNLLYTNSQIKQTPEFNHFINEFNYVHNLLLINSIIFSINLIKFLE